MIVLYWYLTVTALLHVAIWGLSPALDRPLHREWYVRTEFKLGDLWLGIFWKEGEGYHESWHLYICLLPCLPIHIKWLQRAMRKSTY